MFSPALPLIASIGLGQAPGLIVPELAPPSLPSKFAEAALRQGLRGDEVVQACTYLGEGVPLCYRLEQEGTRRWFSVAEAADWGFTVDQLSAQVELSGLENPFVRKRVDGGGDWWQVETVDGRHGMVFLKPQWLERVGSEAVVAAPAKGVVLAWNAGDAENDQIMAVGVRRIFDSHDAPVSPLVFRWQAGSWVVWGEARPAQEEQAQEEPN